MARGGYAGQPGARNGYSHGSQNNDARSLLPYGVSAPGAVVQGAGGGTPNPRFHNSTDLERSMWKRTPEAQYP